jgi:hypothetical protein
MDRRNLLTAILFGFIPLSSAVSFAENYYDHGRDKGKKKRQNEDHGGDQDRRYFRSEDFSLLDGYYSGPRNLPPGLRKKYYRTGALPPGWEKKLQPFPPELFANFHHLLPIVSAATSTALLSFTTEKHASSSIPLT